MKGRGATAWGLSAAASIALLLPAPTAMADDAGGHAFFLEQSGAARGAPQRSAEVEEPAASRPLVVRRRPAAPRAPQTKVAFGPQAPVSIFNDKTLRHGDAVMTAKGLRVFVGDHGAPYSDTDFVALSEADGLPRQVEKALLIVDKAPHG